ncbi:MAG: 4Fe-4S binding protein [Spirochaetaceae bacterium]|nr:MAG: 4Fe-4S binding protein [Spirochaetaceae bacterium]
MNYSVRIDESRCVDCGACTRECQRHLPVYRESTSAMNALECIGCLHCFAVCPQGAISVNFGDANEHAEEWAKTKPLFDLFAPQSPWGLVLASFLSHKTRSTRAEI